MGSLDTCRRPSSAERANGEAIGQDVSSTALRTAILRPDRPVPLSLTPPAAHSLSAELCWESPHLKEPVLLGGALLAGQRPHEQGRTTLMGRSLASRPANTPRAGICAAGSIVRQRRLCDRPPGNGDAVAVFVHDADRSLWRLDLDHPGVERGCSSRKGIASRAPSEAA